MTLEAIQAELETVQKQFDTLAQEKRNTEDAMQRLIGRYGFLEELKSKEENQDAASQPTESPAGESSERPGEQAVPGEIIEPVPAA